MDRTKLVAELNAEIETLEKARDLLVGKAASRGKSGARVMSASARKRIGAAQKARWAKWKAKQK